MLEVVRLQLREGMPFFNPEDGLFANDLGRRQEKVLKAAPALASLRASAQGASDYVDYTIADLYPSLGLSIQYQATYDDSDLVWSLSGAGQLTQSIFCAGRKRRAIDAAVAQFRITSASSGPQPSARRPPRGCFRTFGSPPFVVIATPFSFIAMFECPPWYPPMRSQRQPFGAVRMSASRGL